MNAHQHTRHFAKSDEGMEEVEQADSGMSVIILTEKTPFMLKAVDRKEIWCHIHRNRIGESSGYCQDRRQMRHIGVVEDGVVTKGQEASSRWM